MTLSSKKIFFDVQDLSHCINNPGFYSNFTNMLEKYNSSDLDLETLDNDVLRQIETDMTQKLIFLTGNTVCDTS